MSTVISDPQIAIRRVGFVASGVLLITMSSDYLPQSFAMVYASDTLWALLLGALGFTLLLLGLLPTPPRKLVSLILIGLLLVALSRIHLASAHFAPMYASRIDNEMIAEYAVEALKAGENPYVWNFSDVLRVFRDRGNRVTYFLDGSLQNRVTYPIFPTLLLLAMEQIGIQEVRAVSAFFLIVLLWVMFYGTPERWRPIILLPLFLLTDFVPLNLIGAQDVVWSVLLVGVILTWRRPWLCALLFGLAVSFRQQPWFVAPFLLAVMWHEEGSANQRIKRIVQFFAISTLVFILPNIPFIAADPRAWLLGALEPSYARFDVLSQGIAALTQYGLLPLPREFYTLVQFTFLGLALVVHWRHTRSIGQAFWIFPAVFFWLYYRGLGNYWFYWLPVLIIAITRWMPEQPQPATAQRERARLPRTAGMVAAWAALMLAIGGWTVAQPRAVEMRLLDTTSTAATNPAIYEIELQVRNRSSQPLTPRFAIQFDRPAQTYTWHILSGPEFLSPGESGRYLISAELNPSKVITPRTGAQVVLTDAGGDYRLSAVVTVDSAG